MRCTHRAGLGSPRRQGDADHRAETAELCPVAEQAHVVGEGHQDVPAEAPGVRMSSAVEVVDTSTTNSSTRGSTTNTSVSRGVDDQSRCRPRRRPAEVGHRVEVEILGGRQGTDQGAHHGEVLEPGGHRHLDGTRITRDGMSVLSALDIGWPPGDIDPRLASATAS